MNGSDDEFLDDVFERALAAATDGRALDVEALLAARSDLRAEVEAAAHLALEVGPPRTPGLPTIPGYQVVAELGRGGMGAVYLARQERLGGRMVALKVLPGADALAERARSRFAAEAEALGRLRHPNVVTVHDVVISSTACAYAMEWVEGQSLARWIGSAPTSGREPFACQVALQIARALVAVHAAGLVHRDVKPSNILVRGDDRAVLVDFGLARDVDQSITAGFAGTAPYAAPELLAGDAVADARADVYSLGATLYHALAGTPPFAGRTAAALVRAIELGVPPALRRLNPRIGRDLETIVMTAMAASPARRYASAAALADDLERLLALQPILARPPGLLARSWMLVRRNRLALFGAIVGGVLATVAAFVVLAVLAHHAAIPGRVKAHVEAARLQLLSPEHGERLFVALHMLETQAGGAVDQAAVARALVEYDEALLLAPDDLELAVERAAVVAASRVAKDATRALGSFEGVELLATYLSRWRSGDSPPAVADAELAAASGHERRALGLFAYLTGNADLCSRAWEQLDLAVATDPLVDAALGEMHLQREQPALAYPRLEAASRAFPSSGFMRVQLAAAAVRCGDVARAGRLLDEADGMSGHDRFSSRKAVRAEWHAARGDVAEAQRLFEWMRANHKVPSTRARYARWLAGRGELMHAITLAGEAITIQPALLSWRQPYVELVEGWWRGLDLGGKRQWLTELAARGTESWLLGVLRLYADSVGRLDRARQLVGGAAGERKTTIAMGTVASSGTDRRFLLDLLSALESSPVTLALFPQDSLTVRSLQVSAWQSPVPRVASMLVRLLRGLPQRFQTALVNLLAVIGVVASTGETASGQACVPAPSGLASWWPANGSATDSIGPNHAALVNGTSYGEGRVGQGFAFDGVDDHVVTVLPASGLSLAGGFTVAGWLRTSTTTRQNFLTYYSAADTRGINIQIPLQSHEHANRLLCDVYAPWPGNWVRLTSLGPVNDGVWHFIALSRDASSVIRLHVDGALQASATLLGDATPSDSRLFIGSGGDGATDPWSGSIDEVDLYSRALTAAEIQAIYAAGSAGKCMPTCVEAPVGLVSWWRGNGDATDTTGGNHALTANGASFAAGRVGQAFSFDGLDDYVTTTSPPTNLSLSGAFALAFWFRGSASGTRNIVTYLEDIYLPVPGEGLNVQVPESTHPAGGRLLCDIFAPFPGNWVRLLSASPVNDGVWHFAVLSRDAGNLTALHLDGSLQATALLVGDATPSLTNFIIGGGALGTNGPELFPPGHHPWSGLIDEVDFYNRALTPTEIHALYAAGSAGKCLPNPVGPTQTTVDTNLALVSAFAGQATITVIPKNTAGALLGAGRTVSLTTTAGTLLGTITDNGDGTYTQTLQASPTATSATVSATVDGIAITDTATVTFVPIDPSQSTITVAPDTTFLGGHATVTVTPKNDLGAPVGPGKTIVLQTTLGTLFATVTDHGDGTYSQRLDATAIGTAVISATADGLPLTTSASLTILDSSIGRVIGMRADLTAVPYNTIQQAVNRAELDVLTRILVTPGVHEEVVTVKQRHHLSFEGLSATGLVTVRGFLVSQCHDLAFAWFDIDASVNARHGIDLVGSAHANQRVLFHQCSVRDAAGGHDGIRIARDNCDIVLDTLWLQGNSGDGIQLADGHCGVEILDTTILSSGQVGIRCAEDAVVTIGNCRIEDNGAAGEPQHGYAIFRQRRPQGGNPTTITLLGNTFLGNRGRVIAGKSDANLGNYDQILDASDSQAGY